MADRTDEAESWTIGTRAGRIAGIGAVAIPVALLAVVAVTGWFYDREVRPKTYHTVATFPAPGIETFIHDGTLDPHAPAIHARPDPAVQNAKRDIARAGLPGWKAR